MPDREDSRKLPEALHKASDGPKSRLDGLEERFLGLCLSYPSHFTNLTISESDFGNESLNKIFCEVKKFLDKKEDGELSKHLDSVLSPELKMRIDCLSLQIDQQPRNEEEILLEIKTCLKELKLLRLRQQIAALSFDIKDAQGEEDKSKIEKLIKKFNQLTAELTEEAKIDSAV
jgi:hypothetical protein